MRASAAKRLKKSSSGPNIIDGRMIVAAGCAASTSLLGGRLACARRRDGEFSSAPIAETCTMRAPCACAAQRHLLGAVSVHGVETLASALEQDADQIDQHVRVARRRLDRSGVAHIGLHRMDLPDAPERLQVPGELRPAHRHADAVAAAGERAHHVAAEKARAAIDGDQRVGGAFWHSWRRSEWDRASCRPYQDRGQVLYRPGKAPVLAAHLTSRKGLNT